MDVQGSGDERCGYCEIDDGSWSNLGATLCSAGYLHLWTPSSYLFAIGKLLFV